MALNATVRKGELDRVSAPPWRRAAPVMRIVLPAYNEAENLGALLERIDESMYRSGRAYEVLVVDDGSRDPTAEIAGRYASLLPLRLLAHEVNQGLGATIRDGLVEAIAVSADDDVIIVMDADNTHTPALIPRMLQAILEGSDVVIASRYRPGSRVLGVTFLRRCLSFWGSVLFRLMFPTPGVRDYTCGFRAYRAGLLKACFRESGSAFVNERGFQCMVAILLDLRARGAIFREVPLILRYDHKRGASKMKVASTILGTLWLMARRRLRGGGELRD